MPEKNYTDEELMPLIRQGNAAAFELLYNRYAEGLTSFAASRLTSLEEARDVIHDLFVYVWRERENISIRISARAFLYSAVRYRIVDHIRKNITREKYLAHIEKLDISLPGILVQLDTKDLQDKIDFMVENLSPRVQRVFKMSRYENLSVKEIAQNLGITERTVKNQLATALAYLRENLGPLAVILMIF